MNDYRFANLDETDLQYVTELEQRLSTKHGAAVVLIAYAGDDGVAGEDALASLNAPDEYGPTQAAKETGEDMEFALLAGMMGEREQ